MLREGGAQCSDEGNLEAHTLTLNFGRSFSKPNIIRQRQDPATGGIGKTATYSWLSFLVRRAIEPTSENAVVACPNLNSSATTARERTRAMFRAALYPSSVRNDAMRAGAGSARKEYNGTTLCEAFAEPPVPPNLAQERPTDRREALAFLRI